MSPTFSFWSFLFHGDFSCSVQLTSSDDLQVNDKNVTQICNGTFQLTFTLWNVKVPYTERRLKESAPYGCTKRTSLTLMFSLNALFTHFPQLFTNTNNIDFMPILTCLTSYGAHLFHRRQSRYLFAPCRIGNQCPWMHPHTTTDIVSTGASLWGLFGAIPSC